MASLNTKHPTSIDAQLIVCLDRKYKFGDGSLVGENDENIFDKCDNLSPQDIATLTRLFGYIRSVSVIQSVHALESVEFSDKRPKEKVSELSLDFGETPRAVSEKIKDDQAKFRPYSRRTLHYNLFPTIRRYRKKTQYFVQKSKNFFQEACKDINEMKMNIDITRNDIAVILRSPNNFGLRASIVATATLAGFTFGSPGRSLFYKRFFWSGMGALSSGCLCFPEETDKVVKQYSYKMANSFLSWFNWWFDTDIHFRKKCCISLWEPKDGCNCESYSYEEEEERNKHVDCKK